MFAPSLPEAATSGPPWVVAVVDDEPGVHEVSRLVLRRLRFDGRPLEIVSAHSAQEGRQLFKHRGDVAVALIDVVMEDDRAGLDLVQHLRDDLGNKLTRVILRTGQPGMAPEREIVTHFEIDDYKDKSELTADRLFTAVYAALRAYQALWGLEQTRRGLSRIADAAGRLMGYDSTERFFAESLREMAGMAAMVAGQGSRGGPAPADSLSDIPPDTLPDGLAVAVEGPEAVASILAATGGFAGRIGQPLEEVIGPERAARVARVAREGGMARDDDGAFLGLDAGNGLRCALWVSCAVAPSREVNALWQVFATKLSDVARARRAIEARTEMAAAERELRAKSRFMSRMSHELRTPLNAMLGFTQLMLSEPEAGPGGEGQGADSASALRRERLQHIASAGRHLLSLIDDILDLSRLEGGEVALRLESVRLAPLLAQVLPLVAPLAQAHGVYVAADAGDTVLRADATRLRQVLLNLLTNAIKYNQPGGTVHVRVDAGDDDRSQGPVGHPRLRVIDTGRGLSTQQIRQLFQPFNRLGAEDSGVEGTGIGLAIVKSLVERMGGLITVASVPGSGSTFTVTLPPGNGVSSSSDVAELAVTASAPADPPSTTLQRDRALTEATPAPILPAAASPAVAVTHLLYIEDNPVNAMIVAELLKRRVDLVLHLAEDGERGVSTARSLIPDLILLDMQLPDMDGHEVFRRLQADPGTARIPCVALSANVLQSDIDRALAAGFAAYLTKPFEFDDFLTVIDGHVLSDR